MPLCPKCLYDHGPHEERTRKEGMRMDTQYAATSPSYLLDGLIAQNELRELLDLLYDELEARALGLLA
jgi:hypothetical protein